VGTITPLPPGVVESVTRPTVPLRSRPGVPPPEPDRVVARELSRVRAARPGCRNATLNRAAFMLGLLAAADRIAVAEADDLLDAAAGACGLPAREAVPTIRIALSAGVRKGGGIAVFSVRALTGERAPARASRKNAHSPVSSGPRPEQLLALPRVVKLRPRDPSS